MLISNPTAASTVFSPWHDGPDGLTVAAGGTPALSKACPVLIVGSPRKKGPAFMRLVHGKHKFWAAYNEALAVCRPDTVELLGVVRGRWRLFVVRRDTSEVLKVAQLLPRRGGRKKRP